MYTRIVVPLDGSRLAEQVLPQAKELVKANGASLHLIRIVAFSYLWDDGPTRDQTAMAGAYLDTMQQLLQARGVRTTIEVRAGQTHHELVAALRLGDLLVLASRGTGRLAHWVIGSIAGDVVLAAPVPVLVIRLSETLDYVIPAEVSLAGSLAH